MRVLYVITGLGLGGTETLVTGIADRLVELGHEARIIYLTGEAVRVPVHSQVVTQGLGLTSVGGVLRAFRQLRRSIAEFNPDIVHSHLFHANVLTRLVRATARMPCLISTAHSRSAGGRLRRLAYRLTDSLSDLSTNVSDEAVTAFVRQGAVRSGRMITVHNGISTDSFAFSSQVRDRLRGELRIAATCNLLLAVGNLTPPKDYPNLLSAAAKLSKSASLDFKLAIVGEGELRNSLHALANELGISSKVMFLGQRRDVPDLMSAADIFVLSSAWEGFSLVVAEAMASERVVVATDCGGVREVLAENGFLVRPRDSDALVTALRQACALPAEARATLGRLARQRVLDHFSFDRMFDRWLDVYRFIRPPPSGRESRRLDTPLPGASTGDAGETAGSA